VPYFSIYFDELADFFRQENDENNTSTLVENQKDLAA